MALERFECPNCKADMEFDPVSGGMKCSYCGTSAAVQEDSHAGVHENPLSSESLKPDPSRIQRLSAISKEFTCTGCGATVQFDPPQVAGTCPFCAANIVAQPKDSDPLIAPDGVLPFTVPKDQAAARVRDWIASRWFAPDALAAVARPEGIRGMYLPFWTFDAKTNTRYTGQRGDHYYETVRVQENVNGQQVMRDVQQVRTAWQGASGAVGVSYDDILVPASKSVSPDRLRQLEPWKLTNVKPYDSEYLSGFQAQRYQVELKDGFAMGRQIMERTIQGEIARDIGGDEQRIDGSETRYSNLSFKHLLLPVWVGAFRFEGRVFQVLVNAQTGEVTGERPYSKGKVLLLILVIVLVLIFVLAKAR